MGTHGIPSAPGRRSGPGLLVVAGAGLIGSRLADMARDSGWRIRILHRSGPGKAPREGIEIDASGREHAWWAPAERILAPGALEGARAVVCLSGAPIAPRPWTPARRRALAASRLSTTALIARVAAGLPPAGRPGVLLSGSATGFYGDRGDEILTEACGPGEGFLSELCLRWEAAAGPAARAGLRTVQSRTGLVVSSSGGPQAWDSSRWRSRLRRGSGAVRLTGPRMSSCSMAHRRPAAASSSPIHGCHWSPRPSRAPAPTR